MMIENGDDMMKHDHTWIITRGEYVCCECGLVGPCAYNGYADTRTNHMIGWEHIKTKRAKKTAHYVLCNISGNMNKKLWYMHSIDRVLKQKLIKRKTIVTYLDFIYSRNKELFHIHKKRFKFSQYAEIIKILNIRVRPENFMVKVSRLLSNGKMTFSDFNKVLETQKKKKCSFKMAMNLHGFNRYYFRKYG